MPIPDSESPHLDDYSKHLQALELDWQSAQVLRPTLDSCWDRVAELLSGSGCACCPGCGHDKFTRVDGRMVTCDGCRTNYSSTPGTIFHSVRHVDLQLFMMERMDMKRPFTCNMMSKVTGKPVSTVQRTFKRLKAALAESMPEGVEALSLFFADSFSKRSRNTPANQHPRFEEPGIAEQDAGAWESDNGASLDEPVDPHAELNPSRADQTELGSAENPGTARFDRQQEILSLLSTTPISTDQLAMSLNIPFPELSSTLTILELYELIQRLPGDRYVIKRSATTVNPSPEVAASCRGALAFVRDLFNGISRKYLPLYLALHGAYFDEAARKGSSLMEKFLKAGKISYQRIMNMVCPSVVRVYASSPTSMFDQSR